MIRTKITVVGAGNVGATTAQRLVEKNIADIVLVDIVEGLAAGKALDLAEAAPVAGYESRVTGSTSYDATEGSRVVIVTSGVPRKPGMSRDDLLGTNARIVQSVTHEVAAHAPEAVLIMVANPLDAMTYVAHKTSGFPAERVLGMAGILDTARFRAFVAEELGVSVRDVTALVLGGHGDTMVPCPEYTAVAGVPIAELMAKDRLESLIERTRRGGAEIVSLLKTGSAFYAPSAAAAEMAEAIVLDRRIVRPCAALCRGQYGIDGLFVGVPVLLGARGAEKIMELPLHSATKRQLDESASAVRRLCAKVDALLGSAGSRNPSQ